MEVINELEAVVVAGPAAHTLAGERALAVAAVYQRVVNLTTPAGEVLALHAPGLPLTPMSVVVPVLPQCRPGQPAARSAGRLWLGGCAFWIERTPVWPSQATRRPLDWHEVVWLRELVVAFLAGDARWWAGGLPAVGSAVARALAAGGAPAALAQALVGRGPGLTPAGDDLLVGLALAGRAWLNPTLGTRIIRAVAQAAVRARAVSTPLGAAFLAHAGRGDFSQPLLGLAARAAAGDAAGVRECLAEIATLGATSGLDALTGTLAGLEAAVQGKSRAAHRTGPALPPAAR